MMFQRFVPWAVLTALSTDAFLSAYPLQRTHVRLGNNAFSMSKLFSRDTMMDFDDSSRKSQKRSNFDRMKNMEVRLNQLERQAPEVLFGFYEPHFKSFSVRPGTAKVGLCALIGFKMFSIHIIVCLLL